MTKHVRAKKDEGTASPAEALKEQVLVEQQLLLEELERTQERISAQNRELRAHQQALEETVKRQLTEQLQAESRLLASRDRLATMAAEMNLIDERARRHISRQLHDQVVQRLALGKIKLDLALKRNQLPDNGAVRELMAVLEETMTDLRDLSFDLSPPILYEVGLNAALGSLGARFAREHGFRFVFPGEECEPALGEDLKIALFQIARELLINTVKHARASLVTVQLQEGETVRLVVSDDGVGFDGAGSPEGFGLTSIRQRIGFMGGGLQIVSAPGEGTSVEVTLPARARRKTGHNTERGSL